MVCPDGTIALAPGTATGELREERAIQDLTDMNLRGWWKNLDDVSQYTGLLHSLEVLTAMLKENTFDGVIGFSQGAALATMLAALCEGGAARSQALAQQGEPFFIAPPQLPFKFALLSCGHKGTEKYYSGFYNPRLTTPILFDVATLDHMIDPSQSDVWVSVCARSKKILRPGGHWFPRNEKSLHAMVSFASQALCANGQSWHSHGPATEIYSNIGGTKLWSPQEGHEARKWTATGSASHLDMPISRGRSRCALSATSLLRIRPAHNCAKGGCARVAVVE